MSKQYPECPLYNHATCKELHNPKLCSIVRDDKTCFKKRQKARSKDEDEDGDGELPEEADD
ncbi:MAG: hypothetical protein V1793_22200 [Pseudomonadota bacterium]